MDVIFIIGAVFIGACAFAIAIIGLAIAVVLLTRD